MTDAQLKRFKKLLKDGRSPLAWGTVEDGDGWPFLRGWNGGVEYAEKMLMQVLQGESNGSHEQTPGDGAGAKVRSDTGEAA